MELLEFKHQSEQDQFKLIVEMSVDKNLQQEVLMMSQQQRKDQLSRLKSKHESTPMGIFIFICKICHKSTFLNKFSHLISELIDEKTLLL